MKNLIYVFSFLSLYCITAVASEQKLVFSGIQGAVNSDISFKVLQEAYKALDINIEYFPLPGERSLQTSNAGKVDGEIFRIGNIQRKYHNLIQVPTAINILEGVAYSHDPSLTIKHWKDLEGIKTGIQVGIKFAEKGTRGMSPTMVDTNEQLFKMLDSNRIEIAIVALTNGMKTIKNLQLNGLYASYPPIQSFPLYHYLHKKNKKLIDRLDAVLQEMKKSGRIMQIRNDILNIYRPLEDGQTP